MSTRNNLRALTANPHDHSYYVDTETTLSARTSNYLAIRVLYGACAKMLSDLSTHEVCGSHECVLGTLEVHTNVKGRHKKNLCLLNRYWLYYATRSENRPNNKTIHFTRRPGFIPGPVNAGSVVEKWHLTDFSPLFPASIIPQVSNKHIFVHPLNLHTLSK